MSDREDCDVYLTRVVTQLVDEMVDRETEHLPEEELRIIRGDLYGMLGDILLDKARQERAKDITPQRK